MTSALVALAAVLPAGCLQSMSLVKVNADGSGTIENQTVVTAAALAQMQQLAGVLGGNNGRPVDPFSEDQMRQLATQMGEGVTLVSTRPLSVGGSEGREAVYAFADVTKLRLNEAPPTPGNAGVGANGVGLADNLDGSLTVGLVHTPAGTTRLSVHLGIDPVRSLTDQLGSAGGGGAIRADQLALVRPMLAGMRIALRVEPAGRLVTTNSPYVDGGTVTIFDIDVDELLNADTLVRLQGAKTADEAREVVKDLPGVKMTFKRDVTIEFAP